MSEFTFPCPACGQNITGDPAQAGTEMTCPVCKTSIIAPSEPDAPAAPALDDPPPVFTDYHAGATPVTAHTSKLAIASFALSLSSLITCFGWLPGIICGHLAQSRLARDSSLKGRGLARAGLIIGYSIILLEVAIAGVHIWRFSAALKKGFANVQQDLATNQLLMTATAATNAADEGATAALAATNATASESAGSGWLADLSQASFPEHPAAGKIHALDFNFKSALFKRGALKINSTNGMYLEIMHGLGDSIENQSFEVRADQDDAANLRVRIFWHEDDAAQSATFSKGYSLKLQIGKARRRIAPAKIYVCFPDDAKSYVAGTFKVRLAIHK